MTMITEFAQLIDAFVAEKGSFDDCLTRPVELSKVEGGGRWVRVKHQKTEEVEG